MAWIAELHKDVPEPGNVENSMLLTDNRDNGSTGRRLKASVNKDITNGWR